MQVEADEWPDRWDFEEYFDKRKYLTADDAAVLPPPVGRMAVSTDGFIVSPEFWQHREARICGAVMTRCMAQSHYISLAHCNTEEAIPLLRSWPHQARRWPDSSWGRRFWSYLVIPRLLVKGRWMAFINHRRRRDTEGKSNPLVQNAEPGDKIIALETCWPSRLKMILLERDRFGMRQMWQRIVRHSGNAVNAARPHQTSTLVAGCDARRSWLWLYEIADRVMSESSSIPSPFL